MTVFFETRFAPILTPNQNTHNSLRSSQLGFDLDEDLDEVEASGLKSRLKAMQKKLASLEQEKVQLSMAKAPLEARLRQNEDVWNKEKVRRSQSRRTSLTVQIGLL